MKFKSAAGVVCHVSDLATTIDFYERLGFVFKTKDASQATAYVNWWWIEFRQVESGPPLSAADSRSTPTSRVGGGDEGVQLCFSVADVRETFAELVRNGIEPLGEPARRGDRTQLVVHDPDGYPIMIFARR